MKRLICRMIFGAGLMGLLCDPDQLDPIVPSMDKSRHLPNWELLHQFIKRNSRWGSV